MYWSRMRPMTRDRSAERVRRRVAEAAVWLCEGRRKSKGLRRREDGAGMASMVRGASRGSRIGLGSSFMVTGMAALILSVGLMLMGWRGRFVWGGLENFRLRVFRAAAEEMSF